MKKHLVGSMNEAPNRVLSSKREEGGRLTRQRIGKESDIVCVGQFVIPLWIVYKEFSSMNVLNQYQAEEQAQQLPRLVENL